MDAGFLSAIVYQWQIPFYVPPIQAVTNSLTTALMAALIAVMIGLLISIAADRYPWTKRINPLFMFPLNILGNARSGLFDVFLS